ncbi:hypothetical protein DAPPUDRAFT_326093 [Daphnia pulex]|uniref:Uncharacterized protein n=1 Tax=Daphnia pulex TaxID=6669 RepID=E9H6Q0_DAPPU|nr:hypothetical protein DAPPUDRAFT_326093 [Daphnia pulex]|eukprot:EFX72549.1 hypothetical protein DAPPUDRAFT_326093 [Daphnia pulex]
MTDHERWTLVKEQAPFKTRNFTSATQSRSCPMVQAVRNSPLAVMCMSLTSPLIEGHKMNLDASRFGDHAVQHIQIPEAE